MSAPSGSPQQSVLDAFDDGATTLDDVARRVGLSRDVVDAVVEYLLRTGRLAAERLTAGCPDGGCGACPVTATGVECSERAARLLRKV